LSLVLAYNLLKHHHFVNDEHLNELINYNMVY